MKWFHALDALYGLRLDVQQIDLWEEFLAEINPTQDEITGAIRRASEKSIKPENNFRPTANDLIKWVKTYRFIIKNKTRRIQREQRTAAVIGKWKPIIQPKTTNDFLEELTRIDITCDQYNHACDAVLGANRIKTDPAADAIRALSKTSITKLPKQKPTNRHPLKEVSK